MEPIYLLFVRCELGPVYLLLLALALLIAADAGMRWLCGWEQRYKSRRPYDRKKSKELKP